MRPLVEPMQNPWLSIPLSGYERHMSLPRVGQAQMLSDEFESQIAGSRTVREMRVLAAAPLAA
jgi:hypothetical protein